MKLSREDLTLLMDQARKDYIEISPEACLPGTARRLNSGERVAVSWLSAAILVLNKNAALNPNFDMDLEFDLPDFTPPTDGYDSVVDLEEKEE